MLRYICHHWLTPVFLVTLLKTDFLLGCTNDYTSLADLGHCDKPKPSNPIRIGIVACVGQRYMTHRYNTPQPGDYDFLQSDMVSRILVLTKSALMSASLHKVPSMEFRVFVDNRFLESWIHQIMKEYQENFFHIDIQFKTHYTFANFPIMTHFQDFVLADKCQNVRLFFPHTLPDVDKILYLDTDTVITGNIQRLWDYYNDMDNSEQICGLAPNNVLEDKNYEEIDVGGFGDVPHVPPKGVNSGLMLMNLNRMRKFDWIDKVMATYEEYDKKIEILQDQKIVNIIFHNNPDKIKVLPCTFNFMHVFCDRGLTCRSSGDEGVHIIHGANTQFQKPESPFYQIFQSYLQFNMTGVTNDRIRDNLKLPLKLYYSLFNSTRTCSGTLKEMLFRDLDLSSVQLGALI